MTDPTPSLGSLALLELREADLAAGIDPATPSPVVQLAPTPPPPGDLRIPAVNWERELAERARLEAEQRERELAQVVAAELERLAPEDTQTRPAPPAKRRWGRSTP